MGKNLLGIKVLVRKLKLLLLLFPQCKLESTGLVGLETSLLIINAIGQREILRQTHTGI